MVLSLAMKAAVWLVAAWGLVACSPDKGDDSAKGGAGTGSTQAGSSGAGAGQPAGGSGSPEGGANSAAGGSAGHSSMGGDGSFAGDASEPDEIRLPSGSQERDGIVNLVDADAADELEDFILDESLAYPNERHSLNKSLNLLLEHYEEIYDFVFFFVDHEVPESLNFGKFEDVTRPAEFGGTGDIEVTAAGYRTTGRVKGVVGFPYIEHVYPPLAHEMMHYWGVHLADSFGFGRGLTAADSVLVHWGYADINGQLGGFDGATLRCETPAGAMPPCTASNGRTRYVVGAFGPHANAFRAPPYAPIELYLMGLSPAAEVPATIRQLTDAKFPEAGADDEHVVVEASGIRELPFTEIQQRHGVPRLLPENERHFNAAFVVISKTPAPASVMDDVASFAAAFGNRAPNSSWQSLETATLGRATMNTLLGARRKLANPPPPPRTQLTCDPLAQDCRPELACYPGGSSGMCALAGSLTVNEACTTPYDCQPGLACVSISGAEGFRCSTICDHVALTGPQGCTTLCPGGYAIFADEHGIPTRGQCRPQ